MRVTKQLQSDIRKAIKALDKAHAALEPLTVLGPEDDPRNSVSTLRVDIREYLEYLERATWWKQLGKQLE